MAKTHNGAKKAPSATDSKQIGTTTMKLATLKDLRKAANQTQEDLAIALGVGQDTISRLEKRSDMLLSTLRQYVESVGGKLDIVATLPDRPPLLIDHLGVKKPGRRAKTSVRDTAPDSQVVAA